MSQTDDDFLFGRPLKEEEEPLDETQLNRIDPLLVKQLEIGERDKKRKDKRYFSAFKLIVGCLVIRVCQVFCVSFKKIFWGGEPPHLYHPTL
uniref:hypothetical protein n=1 Tax=Hungatella hathewayi TaxID=154046 RepID=UPI0011DE043F